MKQTVKRLLAAFLAVQILVSAIPTAFAMEMGEPADTENEIVSTAAPIEETPEVDALSEDASAEAIPVAVEEQEEVSLDYLLSEEAMNAVANTGANMQAANMRLISSTKNQVANGVSYEKIISKNGSGQQNIGFLTKVDLTKGVGIKAAYNGYYAANSTAQERQNNISELSWGFSKTTTLAKEYQNAGDTKGTVVMATNGDYFNMGTGEPNGYLIMEGNVRKASGEPYFAILKDGTATIRDAGTDVSDVQEAISGPFYLIQNGEIVADRNDSTKMPRNGVGICEDGSVVFYLNDGRQAPTSVGTTLYETACVMKDAGCVVALYLDGGGSATVAARPEGGDLKVINSPSDGSEREVSSAILIVSYADSNGVFDHAAITPLDELYTPKSTIQFEASGVDASGAAAEKPDDLQWALAEDSSALGTIDDKGMFTSNGTTGTVHVELRQNGNVVGSTYIEIVEPDEIAFASSEISLGFEATTDFSISVRYMDRDVHIKDGDLLWTITDPEMGKFTGNTFTSSDGKSLTGTVTATSAFNAEVSADITLIVGMLPTLVWDFEDVVGANGEKISAETYYLDSETGLLTSGNHDRGGKQSLEIVSIDDGEPVRFGEKALKLNFDFTECGEVTEGALIGTKESMEIPGVPTAIGVWVYAPEGVGITWEGDGTQAGFWLRGYLKDSKSNSTLQYDFTFEPKDVLNPNSPNYGKQPGIYWEGWKYLEADLTSLQPPYTILKGNALRLMFVSGTKMGTRTSGSIYFDNLQFVYGTNIDDVDNPQVDSIKVDNVELNDGDVLSKSKMNLRVSFSDVQNKYTSGVNTDTVRVYIDGVNVKENDYYEYALNAGDSYADIYNLSLIDGEHSITVSMQDNAGNNAEHTRYFTVKTEEASDLTTLRVTADDSFAPLGGEVTLNVTASDETVQEAQLSVRLNNLYPDVTVEFAEGYQGTYKYDKQTHTVTLSAQKQNAEPAISTFSLNDQAYETVIAKIHVKVPATLTENATFSCEIRGTSYVTESGFVGSFAASTEELPVSTKIAISNETILVGHTAKIMVKDTNGKAVANVGIYLADTDELLGTTNEQGVWETDRYSTTAMKEKVYAKTEDGMLSYQYNIISYAAQGDSDVASSILVNASANNQTQKQISWISSPEEEGRQRIQYRLKGQDDDDWQVTYAQTNLRTFDKNGAFKAANMNSVTLRNLKPGTEYEYQIGNGIRWTELQSFTTGSDKDTTKFFVMSDIQAENRKNVNNVMGRIQEGEYDFGIQTGDAIDDPTSYDQVREAAELFGKDVDTFHVLGNHEYAGDAEGLTAKVMFGLPTSAAGSYYSMTYGNVYVAVINYSGTTSDLQNALEWLVTDAQSSTATWKVLAIHQPPYYTNAKGGNGPIQQYVPTACEQAGINVVFSGHDHSLARTHQLTGGEVDTEKGVLYLIGGSSGEKAYEIDSQQYFDYEKVFALATKNFNATYISATADDYKLVVDIYDVNEQGGQYVVDSYTIYNETGACIRDGHMLEETPVLNEGVFTCTGCGLPVTPEECSYSGWVKDGKTGRAMYFVGGEAQKGEFLLDHDVFYFDDQGVALDGDLTIDEVPMQFENGKLVGGYTGFLTKTDGKTYHFTDGKMTFGWYSEDGKWYSFDAETGVMCTGTHVKPDAEAQSKNAYYDFAENGVLLKGYFNPAGYYYWAGLALADAWVKTGAESQDPDAWYRTNSHGHYVTDPAGGKQTVIAIDDVEYTFDPSNGKLLKGSIVNDDGKLFYYWAGEPVNDGWFDLDGKTYYAYEDGHLATGSVVIDGKNYMFASSGYLITEGAIAYADLTEDYHILTAKLSNVKNLDAVRFAVWVQSRGVAEGVEWVAAHKNEEGIWVAKLPVCQFELKTAEKLVIHAYGTSEEADAFLIGTTVNLPIAVQHAYTDEEDNTCNYCGFVRKLDKVEDYVPMFRLYNPNTGEHHYTGSTEERDNLEKAGWQYEGIAWNAPVYHGQPVYRMFNPNSGDHHYTMSQIEIEDLLEAGWQYEGVAWNCAKQTASSITVFRMYNPNADTGIHHYTNSVEERDDLIEAGWKYEGIAWFGVAP